MPYSSHLFCPPPLQYTAARNDMPPPGKEDIRRPPMPAAAAARRTHGQSSILFMRVSPRGMYLPQKKKRRGHQMTLGDRHSRKDGRNEKTRHVQKGRQAYIQVGQPPPPPPLVSCRIRACLVCNCTSPLVRSSRPPHTQISGDSTGTQCPCRSSADVRSWPVFRAGFNGDGVAQEGRVRDFHTTRAGRAD